MPLGVAKAVRAGSRFDFVTTLIVLVGYAIPGFVLGVVLLVIFGGGSSAVVSAARPDLANWDELSWPARIVDYLWHITLPVTAMVLGSFAVTTMLTKNSFLEEIRKQYVLTARAKGLAERRVLWKHVFRNALIPIVTGFPAAFIGAFFTGSLLIETLFSLDGLGLLSYESVIRRDYPVVLGTLYLFTLIGLVTKLISDLCYVWVDPRVQVRLSLAPMQRRQAPAAPCRSASPGPPRLAALPAQPAGLLEPGAVRACWSSLSLFAEVLSNDRPLVVRYDGQLYFPIVHDYSEKTFGGDFPTPADYLDPFIREQFTHGRQLGALSRPTPTAPRRSTTSPSRRIPAPPSRDNWLGTDDRGRDLLAQLIYGFRVSVLFGAGADRRSASCWASLTGAVQGYFAGKTDLAFQRFIEIWGSMPELYLLIIFSAIFAPSVALLLVLLSLFGWMGLSDYVRAEFLRNRQMDYVQAARALGVGNRQIMWRHILPNSMTPVVTFLPFRMSARDPGADLARLPRPRRAAGHAVARRTAEPGQGQPRRLVDLAVDLRACWCVTLLLLTFMGDALRDALDPRKAE